MKPESNFKANSLQGLFKTKIVATIGPACGSAPMLKSMIQAGMSVARLNFSHGEFETHSEVIERIRASAKAVRRRVTIMANLPGPKIRIGKLTEEPIGLTAGQSFCLNQENHRRSQWDLSWFQEFTKSPEAGRFN